MNYRFRSFSGLGLLAGQITEITLKPFNSSKKARGPGSREIPARGAHTPKPPAVQDSHGPGPPLEPGPLAPQRCRRVAVPAERGPGSKGCGGPGSWCSSTCTGLKSIGVTRAGYPPRAGTPRVFPQNYWTRPF